MSVSQAHGERIAKHILYKNPRKVVEAGRRGSKQDLTILSNLWIEMAPELLKMDLLSVFFGHLDASLVPSSTTTQTNHHTTLDIDRAWISLVALTKLGNIMVPNYPEISLPSIEAQILEAWPDVFKWCIFFYDTRVEVTTAAADVRRMAMDVIGGIVYAFSRSEILRNTMNETPGVLELITRIWVLEDSIPLPSNTPIPVNTAALDALLHFPDWTPPPRSKDTPRHTTPNDPPIDEEYKRMGASFEAHAQEIRARLNRVVEAAGGDVSNIVELAFSRLRSATSDSERLFEPRTSIFLDFVGHLSRSATHPLRLGFLGQGMTAFVTKLVLVVIGLLDGIAASEANARRRISVGRRRIPIGEWEFGQKYGLLDALIACFAFLNNTMESTDGFTWVTKSVSAGLLQAWIGAARHLHRLENPDDAEMIMEILHSIVPRYLVYKSVVNLINTSIKRLKNDVKIEQWDLPEAKEVWSDFEKLVVERYTIGQRMKAVKAAACDNYAQCHNIDLKNNFMKCSGCNTTLYCSRECQKYAWKEGGHKLVCKLKQQEFLEGKAQSISKTDSAFFHHLATSDARTNLSRLKEIAESAYPELAGSMTSLVIEINYMIHPPRLGLHPLAEHEKFTPRLASHVSANSGQRNDELIQRARDHPGEYGIIQSKMANGQGVQLVLSIVPGALLEDEGLQWTGESEMPY